MIDNIIFLDLETTGLDQAKYEYLNTFPFGKFKGQQIDISNREHSSYIDWLLKNTENMDPKFKQHLFELKNFND
jgi:uncharacterized protein YprB with RNaseH-like and TPR domain